MSENTELVENFLKEFDKILESWTRYIENISVPLDERWTIFSMLRPHLDLYLGSPEFDVIGSPDWYEDLGLESGDITSYDDYFVERVQEFYDLSDDQVEDLMNQILREGYRGFRLDY